MYNTLALLKYREKCSASKVADMTTILSGFIFFAFRIFWADFTTPKRTSVWTVLSWASSKITTEYLWSNGSPIASLKSIPSVMYFTRVFAEVASSNRTVYPTSSPNCTLISLATLCAMLIAATRRGWVQAIAPSFVKRASWRYWGIWVVFPLPVSPTIITLSFILTSAIIALRPVNIGKLNRCFRAGEWVFWWWWWYCFELPLASRWVESLPADTENDRNKALFAEVVPSSDRDRFTLGYIIEVSFRPD